MCKKVHDNECKALLYVVRLWNHRSRGCFLLTGDAIDTVYGTPTQFHATGLMPYFIWSFVCILLGIAGFVLGLFGKLPGTK